MTTPASQPESITPRETLVETVYPSVASLEIGQWIGQVMAIPATIQSTPIRLLALVLLGLVTAPVSVLAYFAGKVTGSAYVITNRSISTKKILGGKSTPGCMIAEIAQIEIQTRPGDGFHHVGNLELKDADGRSLLTMTAITRPERVRHLIQELRSVHLKSQSALEQIQSRTRLPAGSSA